MTFEEYQKAIDDMVKSQTPAVNAIDLLDAIKTDIAHTADVEATNEALTTKNKELTESNNKLYNRIFLTEQGKATETESEPEPETKTPEQTFGELFDNRFYGGKK